MFGLVSEKRFNHLQKEKVELELKIKSLEGLSVANNDLRNEISLLKRELAEVKGKIREQTEADLFFISAKIQKKLLDGEPKENVQDLRLQQSLYQQQLAQMQQSPYGNSFLNGLGLGVLGNIFR